MCFDTLLGMELSVNIGGEWQRERIELYKNLCRSYYFSGLNEVTELIRVVTARLHKIPLDFQT